VDCSRIRRPSYELELVLASANIQAVQVLADAGRNPLSTDGHRCSIALNQPPLAFEISN